MKHEFLGRCMTCLDNAFLDSDCTKENSRTPDFPLGVPDYECLARKCQKAARAALEGGNEQLS